MKRIKYLVLSVFCGAMLVFQSCETTELDLTENPNALTPQFASIDLYLNAIQLDYKDNMEVLSGLGASLTRIEYMFGRDYFNNFTPATLNATWTRSYRGMFADVREMTILATEAQLPRHIAIGEILQAHMLITLVDFVGDIPWSQAINPEEFPLPSVDSGAEVYAAAEAMLNSAIANLNAASLGNPGNDLFYGNNFTRWEKLANTLKMKIYLQTRLVDASAASKFNAIVATGDFISSTADDFQFQWGKSLQLPDARHPKYVGDYTPTGAGNYQSNWLLNQMDTNNDPRIRYYFFRQTDETPGATGVDPNEETLNCSLEDAPQHYIDGGFTFCYLDNGYWGRDSGDDAGTPPDGFLRTAYGVYPASGKFDGDNFANSIDADDFVGLSLGGGGNGITPIMLASYVDFMRAEMAMAENNTTAAIDFIKDGLDKSIAKVQSFGTNDPGANSAFFPTAAENTAFVDGIETAFNAADMDGKWNILAEQFFVTQYGSGIDAYNFYRRTGFPTTLQPNIEPNPGNFVRSFLYPSNEISANPSITQKTTQNVQVFWDNNPASAPTGGFPASN